MPVHVGDDSAIVSRLAARSLRCSGVLASSLWMNDEQCLLRHETASSRRRTKDELRASLIVLRLRVVTAKRSERGRIVGSSSRPRPRRSSLVLAEHNRGRRTRTKEAKMYLALGNTGARPGEIRSVTAKQFRLPGVWVFEEHKTAVV